MKKYLKPVQAAEDSTVDRLDAAIDELNDDFDYIISGLEKLGRSGANGENDALVIAENLQASLNTIISEIADTVAEGE